MSVLVFHGGYCVIVSHCFIIKLLFVLDNLGSNLKVTADLMMMNEKSENRDRQNLASQLTTSSKFDIHEP